MSMYDPCPCGKPIIMVDRYQAWPSEGVQRNRHADAAFCDFFMPGQQTDDVVDVTEKVKYRTDCSCQWKSDCSYGPPFRIDNTICYVHDCPVCAVAGACIVHPPVVR